MVSWALNDVWALKKQKSYVSSAFRCNMRPSAGLPCTFVRHVVYKMKMVPLSSIVKSSLYDKS